MGGKQANTVYLYDDPNDSISDLGIKGLKMRH